MPRYPSSRGLPAEHLLSDADLEYERQARRFQREVNHQRYLAWYTVVRRIKPNQRYLIVSYGYLREALSGHEILDHHAKLVNARSCTYINELQPVPDDYRIPAEDLWLTYVDESGHTVVQNAEQDVWDHTWFTATTPEMEARITQIANEQQVDYMMFMTVKRQQGDYPATPDFDQVLDLTRHALVSAIDVMLRHLETPTQEDLVSVFPLVDARTSEAFDRIFGLARIRAAGVNIDQHPEYGSYQRYYELGMPPPTHAQMADTIIDTFGSPQPEDINNPTSPPQTSDASRDQHANTPASSTPASA